MGDMLAIVLFAALAQSPAEEELKTARQECERSIVACARAEELEARVKAEHAAKADADAAARKEKEAATLQSAAEDAAREQAEENALRKKCGADYMRVRVGMRWTRVKECAGNFDLVGEDARGAVYEAEQGVVRVERGRVVRWIAK